WCAWALSKMRVTWIPGRRSSLSLLLDVVRAFGSHYHVLHQAPPFHAPTARTIGAPNASKAARLGHRGHGAGLIRGGNGRCWFLLRQLRREPRRHRFLGQRFCPFCWLVLRRLRVVWSPSLPGSPPPSRQRQRALPVS